MIAYKLLENRKKDQNNEIAIKISTHISKKKVAIIILII